MVTGKELKIKRIQKITVAKPKKIKKTLKNELQLAKSERRKDVMKRLVKDAKSLQKTIKDAKKHNAKTCPHCGGEII